MTVMGKFHNHGKRFSKSKKQNIKHGKIGKKDSTGKRGRLIVRNLPFKCNEDDLQEHFKSFGEIKDIQLLRRPDKKLVGCGFVEFTSRLSATKAAEQLSGKPFLGRPIYIEKAVSRDNYDETTREGEKSWNSGNKQRGDDGNEDLDEDDGDDEEDELSDEELDTSKAKEEVFSSDGENEDGTGNKPNNNKPRKKKREKSTNLKKARLIVRNLSFKTTEEQLKQHFSQFGEVTEVRLLRKPDNSLVGCGFVQFSKKLAAAKAIHHASGKPFLGRPIIVDWALAKDKFKKMQEEAVKKEIKKEDESDEETKPIDVSGVTIKKEETSDEESSGDSEKESDESDSDKEKDDDDDDDDDDEDDEEDEDVKPNIKKEPEEGQAHQRREDVDEGRTVFVKNLPFAATDEEFRECMEQFGPVFYALVCKDKLTEHSKGSGFVKYKNKEDAEKCLSAGTELTLKGSILDPHPALKRSDIQKLNDKSKDKKDNRNLYLVKEGMIVAGTPAAKGVSVADMEKRLQLEQWKNTKLKHLNMLVSRTRLVIHNLPAGVADRQLRRLFQKHAGPKAVIKEARVMRDLKQSDSKGRPVSKGYGFVAFEKHEDALKALRSINNNPDIFSPTSRPIVSFSIENRSVLNAKEKRLQRSQQKNPLCKNYKSVDGGGEANPKKKFKKEIGVKNEDQTEPEFAGMAAKPGQTVKMRKKYKLQDQAQKHVQDVRKQKQEQKLSRKMRRKEHIQKKKFEKVTSKKKKTVEKDEAFSKLVDKYKSKLLSQTNKKKWYDE